MMRAVNVAVAAAVLALAGGAWAGEVKVAKGKGGSYLTDAKGMALYTFKKDSPGKSACMGDCVGKWPLYEQDKVDVTDAVVKASDFATITRDDGKKQTTYKGMPLYYFAADQGPGDTKGDGVGGVWTLAKP